MDASVSEARKALFEGATGRVGDAGALYALPTDCCLMQRRANQWSISLR